MHEYSRICVHGTGCLFSLKARLYIKQWLPYVGADVADHDTTLDPLQNEYTYLIILSWVVEDQQHILFMQSLTD